MKEPLWFVLLRDLCELLVEWDCQTGEALPMVIKMASDILYDSLQRLPL